MVYALYYRKQPGLLEVNDVLFRSPKAFGSFASTFYLLGFFPGINSFIGAVTRNSPPMELGSGDCRNLGFLSP